MYYLCIILYSLATEIFLILKQILLFIPIPLNILMFGIDVILLPPLFFYTVTFSKKNPQIQLKLHVYISGKWIKVLNNLIKCARAVIVKLRQISGLILILAK